MNSKAAEWSIVLGGAFLIAFLVEQSPKLGGWVLILFTLGLLMQGEKKGLFN